MYGNNKKIHKIVYRQCLLCFLADNSIFQTIFMIQKFYKNLFAKYNKYFRNIISIFNKCHSHQVQAQQVTGVQQAGLMHQVRAEARLQEVPQGAKEQVPRAAHQHDYQDD